MDDKPAKENLAQGVDALIPKKLNDIIRKNRELMEFSLSTVDDIQALNGEIQHEPSVKDIIDDWRLISLREKQSGRAQVLLLGHSRMENAPWLTSSVVRIDLTQSRLVTKSGSLYALGSQGNGEPPPLQLIHICATLHHWGSGEFLGVPHFFY